MTVQVEATGLDEATLAASIADVMKMKAVVEIVPPGTLPRDGIVIEDTRSYD